MRYWTADSDRDFSDDVHGPYPKANAICPCGREFVKGAEDTGSLCDRCCDERDIERIRQRERNDDAYRRGVLSWFRKKDKAS